MAQTISRGASTAPEFENKPDIHPARRRVGSRVSDLLFQNLTRLFALTAVALIVGIGLTLLLASRVSLGTVGGKFFVTKTWDPVDTHNIFGVLPFVYGTAVTSLIALLIAVPVGIGAAIFLAEIAPRWLSAPVSYLVELLAAVPSIVYGFWAFLYLVPLLNGHVEPWLTARFGNIPIFMASDSSLGLDFFSAGIVLALMALPFITAVSRDVLRTVPMMQREAAYGLGATKWEAIKTVVIRYASGGVIGAVMLGLGRAIGETMAVTLVIGNSPHFPTASDAASFSLFHPGYTMTSLLASEYNGADTPLYRSALSEVALTLFVVTIVVNGLARVLVWLTARHEGGGESALAVAAKGLIAKTGRGLLAFLLAFVFLYQIFRDVETRGAAGLLSLTAGIGAALLALLVFNHSAPGRPYYLRWRKIGNGFALLLCAFCAFAACAALAVIFYYVARLGLPTLTPKFFRPPDEGGMLHAIAGTGVFIFLASLIGIPLGVFGGVYLSEFGSNRLGWWTRFAADLLNGVPSIVLGIFAYVLISLPSHGKNQGLAGGFALGVMMTPTVMRTTEELLRLVPMALREGSLALGASRARTVWQVILPTARGGIVTGILLAIARIAGETAPLLMVGCDTTKWNLDPRGKIASLPMQIYKLRDETSSSAYQQLWGVALLLVLLVLVFSLLARYATRDKMKMSA